MNSTDTFSDTQPPAETPIELPLEKKRKQLPKSATDLLRNWIHQHAKHPYPTDEEKKELCAATGLSMTQLCNWMINVCSYNYHNVRSFVLTPILGSSPYPVAYEARASSTVVGIHLSRTPKQSQPRCEHHSIAPSRELAERRLRLLPPTFAASHTRGTA